MFTQNIFSNKCCSETGKHSQKQEGSGHNTGTECTLQEASNCRKQSRLAAHTGQHTKEQCVKENRGLVCQSNHTRMLFLCPVCGQSRLSSHSWGPDMFIYCLSQPCNLHTHSTSTFLGANFKCVALQYITFECTLFIHNQQCIFVSWSKSWTHQNYTFAMWNFDENGKAYCIKWTWK